MLEKITASRGEIYSLMKTVDPVKLDKELLQMQKAIFAISENYPALRTAEACLHMARRISDLESSLSDRREFYNETVNQCNTRLESFPDMIVAGMMHLKPRAMFEVLPHETQDVKIG